MNFFFCTVYITEERREKKYEYSGTGLYKQRVTSEISTV